MHYSIADAYLTMVINGGGQYRITMGNKLMTAVTISKTNFLCGIQCPRYLWMMFHGAKDVPQPDESMQFIYEQGRKVGELAKSLFTGGVDIPVFDFAAGILLTREQLKCERPIFEASIQAEYVYCRPDVLVPSGDDRWDIIEVKSATSIKDINILDVAFQRYCCEAAGLDIRNCRLAYINNKYVRQGELDPGQLFIIEDITDRVRKAGEDIELKVEQCKEIMLQPACPDVTIGQHCFRPYSCPLQSLCWSFLPENSVFELYWGGNRRFELFGNGIINIRDIPSGFMLNNKQYIQVDCVKRGQRYIKKQAIRDFLDDLQYPLYFLDFESFATILPVFEGIRPNQQVPFQFSLHVLRHKDAEAEHYSFLADGNGDPRPAFIQELKGRLGESGSIVAYHAPFEQQVLRELAEIYPEYNDWVAGVQARMVDLLKPFVNFHYYHPAQKGSASLKYVLPALTGFSYDCMPISNGRQAGVAYISTMLNTIEDDRKRRIRNDLEAYCGLDTGGMVEIIKKLGDELC